MFTLEGTTLGHYHLERRIACGGMSEIYLANDEHTQRKVAIKAVDRYDNEFVKRFQRELKALALLKHEHILPTFDSGEERSWCYFVMPYIEYGTLRERLAKGPLGMEEAGIILEQVASALQYAHDHGILHRDIKPSNILLRNEQHIYLADFGLAKEVDGSEALTQTGELLGTPEYIAPELTEGPGSASSDIYALGIVLYQMLTGRVPFKAKTPIAVCWKHILEQPMPPSLLNPAISYPVEQVILRALEKEPQRRFQTVREMAQAYRQALKATFFPQRIMLAAPSVRYKVHATATLLPGWHMPHFYEVPHRKVHPAVATLIATVFFCIPLSLGFLASKDGLPAQVPPALGANVVFAEAQSRPFAVPPRLQPTPTPTSTLTPVTRPSSTPLSSGQEHKKGSNQKAGTNGGSRKDHGNGQSGKHGKKRRGGHDHDHRHH